MQSSLVLERQRGVSRSRLLDSFLLTMLLLSFAVLFVLVYEVVRGSQPVIATRGTEFLRSPLSSLAERAGLWQAIVGSLLAMLLVVLVAFPLGIATAVYLEEYAEDGRVTRLVALTVRNLAGVPSIVYGLLGLALFVTGLRSLTGGATVISAGLTLAVLVLPIVTITTAEALRAVPRTIRDGAYGLGATRWQVIRTLVLPAASPGIVTGSVLSLSRALGETAPLLLVGAVTGYIASGGGSFADNIRGPFTSLPTIIFAWARQPNAGFRSLTSAAIVVLLTIILLVNALAVIARDRYQQRW